jgi:hypothetical protein
MRSDIPGLCAAHDGERAVGFKNPPQENLMSAPRFDYTIQELDETRAQQRLTYRIAAEIEARLAPGMSETDITNTISVELARAGISQMFHYPRAWIGERAMLGDGWEALDQQAATDKSVISPFEPTDRTLSNNTSLIIDIAPVSANGLPTDMGYSCILGKDAVYDELFAALQPMRGFLLRRVRAGATLKSIYRELDTMIKDHGYLNCHRRYPAGALGHLVPRIPPDPPGRESPLNGFGTATAETLLAAAGKAMHDHTCFPVWNDSDFADFVPTPGLWAVEPHIGKGSVGAKWEEILVVTDSDAYWIDDDLPHHRKWRGEQPLASS